MTRLTPTAARRHPHPKKTDRATASGAAAFTNAAPDAVALVVFLGAGVAARRSASVASLATHVAATAVLGVLCLAAIFVRDRAFVTSLLGSRRAKAE